MTPKEQAKYNHMYETLRRIAKGYVTIEQVPRNAQRLGLSEREFLEFAYENIQQDAKNGLKGIRRPKSVASLTAASGPPIGTKKSGKR